eukprot:3016790-Rhodomonas_salina.4
MRVELVRSVGLGLVCGGLAYVAVQKLRQTLKRGQADEATADHSSVRQESAPKTESAESAASCPVFTAAEVRFFLFLFFFRFRFRFFSFFLFLFLLIITLPAVRLRSDHASFYVQSPSCEPTTGLW